MVDQIPAPKLPLAVVSTSIPQQIPQVTVVSTTTDTSPIAVAFHAIQQDDAVALELQNKVKSLEDLMKLQQNRFKVIEDELLEKNKKLEISRSSMGADLNLLRHELSAVLTENFSLRKRQNALFL